MYKWNVSLRQAQAVRLSLSKSKPVEGRLG